MDYSIIGFPRIGIHRELKFATEAYFRSEIDADELKRVVSQQRMEQWTRQRDAVPALSRPMIFPFMTGCWTPLIC